MSSIPTPFGMNQCIVFTYNPSYIGVFVTACLLPNESSYEEEAYQMKLIDFKSKLAGTLFALALLFGIGLSANLTAQAQYPQYPNDRTQYPNDRYRRDRDYRDQTRNRRGRTNDNYPDYGGSYNLRQTALNAGYNEGMKAGRDDRNHRRRGEFRDSSSYQRATKDYSSRLGDRGLYQQYFRQGFQTGYADGYRGY
jgi:hypothetical protein